MSGTSNITKQPSRPYRLLLAFVYPGVAARLLVSYIVLDPPRPDLWRITGVGDNCALPRANVAPSGKNATRSREKIIARRLGVY